MTAGGAALSLPLPAATGGDPPLRCFNASSCTISATPEAALARTQFTYTVTDRAGDRVSLTFAITVQAPPPVVETEEGEGEATLRPVRAGESTITVEIGEQSAEVEVSVDEASVGVQLTLREDEALEALAEIDFSTVAEADAPEAPRGFRIAGDDAIVDITLRDADGEAISCAPRPSPRPARRRRRTRRRRLRPTRRRSPRPTRSFPATGSTASPSASACRPGCWPPPTASPTGTRGGSWTSPARPPGSGR